MFERRVYFESINPIQNINFSPLGKVKFRCVIVKIFPDHLCCIFICNQGRWSNNDIYNVCRYFNSRSSDTLKNNFTLWGSVGTSYSKKQVFCLGHNHVSRNQTGHLQLFHQDLFFQNKVVEIANIIRTKVTLLDSLLKIQNSIFNSVTSPISK